MTDVEQNQEPNEEPNEEPNQKQYEQQSDQKKLKTKHENVDLLSVLGRVFVNHWSSYSPPKVVQVIGWTKNSEKPDAKRMTVFVRNVKCDNHHNQFGGHGNIVASDVLDIREPVYKGSHKLTFKVDNDIDVDNIPDYDQTNFKYYLQLGKDKYFLENDLDRGYQWCDY